MNTIFNLHSSVLADHRDFVRSLDLWFWSLPTVRIRSGGIKHSRSGGNDETAKEVKIFA